MSLTRCSTAVCTAFHHIPVIRTARLSIDLVIVGYITRYRLLHHATPRIVLGKNLREGRIEAGLTQVQVVERPGLIQRIFRRSKPATRTSGDAPDMVAIITLAPLKEAPQSGVVVRLPACLSPSPRASMHPEPQAKVEVLRLTVSTGMLDAAEGGRVPFR